MAVSEIVVLPAQPASGAVELFPLGGDGFTSPQSVYAGSVKLAMDVSGGNAQIRIDCDDRYTQVWAYLGFRVDGAVADVDGRLELKVTADEVVRVNITSINRVISGLTGSNTALWTPPPLALTRFGDDLPSARILTDNIDGDTLNFGFRVYNFNREARHRVPLHLLFGFLARASQMIV